MSRNDGINLTGVGVNLLAGWQNNKLSVKKLTPIPAANIGDKTWR